MGGLLDDDSGEADLACNCFVLLMSVLTASESEPSSPSDESEPDNESSKPRKRQFRE